MGIARRFGLVAVTVLLTLAATPHVSGAAADPAVYLSLGDSAAFGFQPNERFNAGYADQLAARAGLRLVKLGCPGETSGSLTSGNESPCDYPAGSQLNQAKRVLRNNAGNVAFITINVGVNDILNVCLNPETLALKKACVDRELPALQANLTKILTALHQAAPGVPIAGLTYWNPFLGLWVIAGPDGEGLARDADRAMRALNEGLVATYLERDAAVAYVGSARFFEIANFTDTVATRWGRVPVNVAKACRWTWFCDRRGPDPHPNTEGYGIITNALRAALRL